MPRKRRLFQISTSEEEDEEVQIARKSSKISKNCGNTISKRNKKAIEEASDSEEEEIIKLTPKKSTSPKNKNFAEDEDGESGSEEEEKSKKPLSKRIASKNRKVEEEDDSEEEEIKKKPSKKTISKNEKIVEENSAEEENAPKKPPKSPSNGNKRKKTTIEEDEDYTEEDEEVKEKLNADEEAQASPIGDPIRASGKGKKKRNHYSSFEYEGNVYELEDPVLLTPASEDEKPYVAIIKDISDSGSGLTVTGQWFYRPEEAPRRGGGTWQSQDTRELFYSFHLDDVPAESVMHRCVVHFVQLNKKLPLRSEHPGFIVQKVYDTIEKRLWKLTDKDYEDCKQEEINQLVKKTIDRIGELPDIENEDVEPNDRNDQLINKWNLRKKNVLPIDTSKANGFNTKSEKATKSVPETPASCPSDASEFYKILAKFKVLTGDSVRDRWSERILQGIQPVCISNENGSAENGIDKRSDDGKIFIWPDSAVEATIALEKASHTTLSFEFQKYNQKMRQLVYNLKNNAVLARRLLNKELDPAVILNMSPNELKDGQTADERTKKEPEESERMQMTDTRCSRCTEKKVAVKDIISAGHGNRYQLECQACGNSWYATGDAIAALTMDARSAAAGNVGTAPWATAKFEDVEKKLTSPRDSERPAVDVFEKSTAPYMPVLENQKPPDRPNKTDQDQDLSTGL